MFIGAGNEFPHRSDASEAGASSPENVRMEPWEDSMRSPHINGGNHGKMHSSSTQSKKSKKSKVEKLRRSLSWVKEDTSEAQSALDESQDHQNPPHSDSKKESSKRRKKKKQTRESYHDGRPEREHNTSNSVLSNFSRRFSWGSGGMNEGGSIRMEGYSD